MATGLKFALCCTSTIIDSQARILTAPAVVGQISVGAQGCRETLAGGMQPEGLRFDHVALLTWVTSFKNVRVGADFPAFTSPLPRPPMTSEYLFRFCDNTKCP